MTRKYAIEGGSGTGKSRLIKEIQKREIYVLEEVAEYVITHLGIRPEHGRERFQEKVLELQLQWENEIPLEREISFQDSGIPRGIAFYKLDRISPPKKLVEEARKSKYEKVFLLDRLDKYEKTSIRTNDEDKAILEHELIKETYEELGYRWGENLIRIPKGLLDYRTELILDFLRFEHDAMKQPEMDTIGGLK